MNNKLRSINNKRNSFRLLDISAYIESVNIDPQYTSINLKIINGMTFSFNWSTRKIDYLRHA